MKKTNANDSEESYLTFECIDMLLTGITQKLRSIPATFDYKFFVDGIKIILEGEFEYAISQSLILIFHHFELFSA